MSKIENASTDLAQTERVLQDDELEAVNGGIIIIGGRGLGGPDTRDPAGNVAAKWSLAEGPSPDISHNLCTIEQFARRIC